MFWPETEIFLSNPFRPPNVIKVPRKKKKKDKKWWESVLKWTEKSRWGILDQFDCKQEKVGRSKVAEF